MRTTIRLARSTHYSHPTQLQLTSQVAQKKVIAIPDHSRAVSHDGPSCIVVQISMAITVVVSASHPWSKRSPSALWRVEGAVIGRAQV